MWGITKNCLSNNHLMTTRWYDSLNLLSALKDKLNVWVVLFLFYCYRTTKSQLSNRQWKLIGTLVKKMLTQCHLAALKQNTFSVRITVPVFHCPGNWSQKRINTVLEVIKLCPKIISVVFSTQPLVPRSSSKFWWVLFYDSLA